MGFAWGHERRDIRTLFLLLPWRAANMWKPHLWSAISQISRRFNGCWSYKVALKFVCSLCAVCLQCMYFFCSWYVVVFSVFFENQYFEETICENKTFARCFMRFSCCFLFAMCMHFFFEFSFSYFLKHFWHLLYMFHALVCLCFFMHFWMRF